jgi:hypothetical protein
MMIRTKLAALAGGLLFGFAAGGAYASIATTQFQAVAPITMQLARHGADDVGCDDHGTDVCAIRGGGEQVARHGADDVGCDDHGTDVCAIRGGGDQVARRGADDVGCDDHGTDVCAAGDRSREA